MTVVQSPARFGASAPRSRLRVTRPGAQQIVSDGIISAYFQELLGPRTSGSLLNIGAGALSDELHHAEMFPVTEYHTFEMPGCPTAATYTGTVNDMNSVSDQRYDWVISTAMLEHLEDPWSAAREMLRITKVGGYIYVSVPFSQIVHYEPRYRDYWRFTPMGLGTLFTGTKVKEVEVWGDNPAKPNGFAVLLQRTDGESVPYAPEVSYWLEFPNEQPWMIFLDEPHTSFDWPVYRLLVEPMSLAHQLHNIRNEYGLRAKLPVEYDDVMRNYKHQYAQRIGTLGVRGGVSYFDRSN
ncbi:MAG TPA: methyltransferase domain-containing protein [Candidatus Baltobacteraceae bacterium]|nr:methyltransferase domain-containing protein [Candidatus Baltobacteraceae bacterium]